MSSTDDVIVVSHAKKASTHVAGQRRTSLDVAGKLVDLGTTISDFDELLSGNCDDIPKAAFYMVEAWRTRRRRLRAWPRPLRNET